MFDQGDSGATVGGFADDGDVGFTLQGTAQADADCLMIICQDYAQRHDAPSFTKAKSLLSTDVRNSSQRAPNPNSNCKIIYKGSNLVRKLKIKIVYDNAANLR